MFIVLAFNYELCVVTRVFRYKPEAEMFANTILETSQLLKESREVEKEMMHEYHTNNKWMENKIEKYHETEGYKNISNIINDLKKILDNSFAPHWISHCEIIEREF